MPHLGHRIGRNCQSAGAEKSFSFRHFALLLRSLQIFQAIAFRRPERVEPVLVDRKLTFRAAVFSCFTARVTSRAEEFMTTKMLSYRQLGERLGCSRDAARALVKRLHLPIHKANDGKALVSVDLGEINHHLMPTHSSADQLPVTAKGIEPRLEATAAIHQAELERERERAERLMSELLRAKADALAARATVTRLEGELAALRSRSWWRRLARRKKQPSGSFNVPQIDNNVQPVFASSEVA